jgi:hypothetical protein
MEKNNGEQKKVSVQGLIYSRIAAIEVSLYILSLENGNLLPD